MHGGGWRKVRKNSGQDHRNGFGSAMLACLHSIRQLSAGEDGIQKTVSTLVLQSHLAGTVPKKHFARMQQPHHDEVAEFATCISNTACPYLLTLQCSVHQHPWDANSHAAILSTRLHIASLGLRDFQTRSKLPCFPEPCLQAVC